MFSKKITYTLEEFKNYTKLTQVEKIIYDFSKELDRIQFNYSKHEKLYRTLTLMLASLLFFEKATYASAPSTGYPEIDEGGWIIVSGIQACIFWVSLMYSLRALFLMTIKGEGDFKNAFLGILICAADYGIPSIFAKIPGLFKF
ncbi:hypothetical protein [uncultured Clostridium sp.]|uniref:hypothetical protein n=1 Tax=uncultured Clostridium sp. TaxID=59620 RepID=UPI0028E75CAD|nr:hypothetical protein [uncultured Clostridium sp.]